ncbi:MAG: type III-A CRISPR-associated protein Cas10/Csm1 [Treponema sp.]|jgi:CRISPR-associated protein Csm1|nr:type III-A CRISPR-associated protein Cas10/Csm1 [Treponema sp.]
MGYNEITLAAWLHDIGIFSQRAGIGSGEQFLQSVQDCLPADVQVTEVIRLAGAWRSPSAYEERLIAHGDRLSRGVEDFKRDDETEPYYKPLVHLVSTIQIGEKAPAAGYCSMKPLEGRAIFPSKDVGAGKQEYLGLWKDFEKDFRALKGLTYSEFIPSLDTLLERYCWCIPVSSQDQDISLYQHLKISAAFAGTLYLYHQDKNTPTKEALDAHDEKAFLFIQGDISGIQKYIFDLKTTDNNAKLLRARSFQIWTLGELMAGYLAGQFGVSRENIITSAGAKFLLLAPNTQKVTEKLPELRLEIESFFLREFAGKLAFVLSGGVPASGRDVQKGNIQTLLNAIGRRGDEAKQQKMQAALGRDGHVLTALYDGLQKSGECEYCETLPANPELTGKKICTNCDSLIKIGGKLVKTDKIILKTEKLSRFDEMVLLLPKEDGQFGYLTDYAARFPLMSLPYAAPKDAHNNLYTFEEIAEKAAGGNKKLAMFKADIDNLGLIFTSPWGKGSGDKISFSRYAQLSRQLHYFFTAFISGFIEGSDKYRDKIYTVFSGGDDLCVLGAWDAVMRFARDFQKELSAFTGGNPSVTLSGGIALAGSRLPVRAIAAMAEEALELAKERRDASDNKIIKNAVSVFGVTVSWEEYEKSLHDAEKITEYMDKEMVSSAVVYKMIDFANRARDAKNGNLRDMLWMSNYRYIIARNIKAEHKEALDFFFKFGAADVKDVMEKSRIAVSYALYMKRKGKEE